MVQSVSCGTSALEYPPDQQPFLLEPICMFVREEKMTSDTASHIIFHAHRELAKDFFDEYDVLDREQFLKR